MRGIVVILALLASLVTGTPAQAHSCAIPAEVSVGRPATVNIGVAAEVAAVVRVDVSIPRGFRLQRVVEVAGWQAERAGDTVRFSGGPVAPYSCGFLSVAGVVAEKGKLVFALTTHGADGSIQRYAGTRHSDLYPAQLVYAGIASEWSAGDRGGRSAPVVEWASWALLAAGGAGGVVLVARRRLAATSKPHRRGRPAAPRGPGRPGSGSSRPDIRRPRPLRRR